MRNISYNHTRIKYATSGLNGCVSSQDGGERDGSSEDKLTKICIKKDMLPEGTYDMMIMNRQRQDILQGSI